MFNTFVGGGPGSKKTCAMLVQNRKLTTERRRLSALVLRGAKRNLTRGEVLTTALCHAPTLTQRPKFAEISLQCRRACVVSNNGDPGERLG